MAFLLPLAASFLGLAETATLGEVALGTAGVLVGAGARSEVSTIVTAGAAGLIGSAVGGQIAKDIAKKETEQIVKTAVADTTVNLLSNIAATTASQAAEAVAVSSLAVGTETLAAVGTTEILETSAISTVLESGVTEATTGFIAETVGTDAAAILAAQGITEESVGKIAFEQLVIGLGIGAISQQDVLNTLNTDATGLFNKVIDSIQGDDDIFTDNQKFFIITPDGQIMDSQDTLFKDVKFVDAYEIGYQTGLSLTFQAYETFKLQQSGLPLERSYLFAAIRTSYQNPTNAYINKKLVSYLTSSDFYKNPNESLKIVNQLKQGFNGKFKSRPWLDDNKNVHILDESGVERVFQYTDENYIKVFGQRFETPQLYGNYVGDGSLGGKLPIDEFDKIAMLHDIDYDNEGYYSRSADLKMLARLSVLLDSGIVTNELTLNKIKFTKFYLEYVAPMTSEVTGTTTEIESYEAGDTTDFFDYIFSNYVRPDTKLSTYGFRNPIRRYNLLLKEEQRKHFYAGLKAGIDQNNKLIYNEFMNQAAIQALDSIPITA